MQANQSIDLDNESAKTQTFSSPSQSGSGSRVNSAAQQEASEVKYASNFERTVQALHSLGYSHDETDAIWSLLAVILHLGNLSVTAPGVKVPEMARSFSASSGVSTASFGHPNGPSSPGHQSPALFCGLHCRSISLTRLAELLGVETIVLQNSLVAQNFKIATATRDEARLRSLSKFEVVNNVLALMKLLYR
jgi:myosin heavy subunit